MTEGDIHNWLIAGGAVLTGFGVLIGVIWKLLHHKIDKADSATATAVARLERSITNLDTSMKAKIAEHFGVHEQRLTNGSLRMDGLNQQIGDLRVELAKNYHNIDESRQLISDLTLPIREQMGRFERLLEDIRRDQMHRSST